MEVAKILVGSTSGIARNRKRIPAGKTVSGLTVSVEFTDPVWEDMIKTVVFRGTDSRITEFDGKTAVIPWEVLTEPGVRIWFGIFGHNPDTGMQLPLIEVDIGVTERATDPLADPGTEPTLPIWAQLQQEVDHLKESTGEGLGITDAKVGQTVEIMEVDENGVPTKWKSVDFPESGGSAPLIGTTEDISPAEVALQMSEGKPFAITHTDSTYGRMVFDSFTYTDALLKSIVASVVFQAYGKIFAANLYGFPLEGTWSFQGFPLATPDDIPDSGGNVAYDEAQTLTDEQKARARENIGAQPAGDYLENTALTTAINTALAQAKESGEFDGADGQPGKDGEPGQPGKDGEPGKDYVLTNEDKTEIAELAADLVKVPSDEHINDLINTALGVIENGTY